MKVKILSGNQAGTVVDMPRLEAQAALASGFAEQVDPPPPVVPDTDDPDDAPEPSPKPSRPAKVSAAKAAELNRSAKPARKKAKK